MKLPFSKDGPPRIIDLSHDISSDMSVYPGTESPVIKNVSQIDTDGFAEKKLTLLSHTGTHMDAPCHIISGKKSLDQYSMDRFIGTAVVVDASMPDMSTIDIAVFKPFRHLIDAAEFVLIHTGWSRFWKTDRYFSDFPVLSQDAARWLCDFQLKGLGVDAISFDNMPDTHLPVHHILLDHDLILIENLTSLDTLLPTSHFIFCGPPLKINQADGSPVRAMAIF